MNRSLVVVLGSISLLVVLLFVLVLQQFETTIQTQEGARTGEASYNRLLAAQHLLQKMGVRAKSVAALLGPQQGIGAQDVIVLPYRSAPLKKEELTWLTEWVAGGGHLITTGLGGTLDYWSPRDVEKQPAASGASSPSVVDPIEDEEIEEEDLGAQDNLLNAFGLNIEAVKSSAEYSEVTFSCCQSESARQAIFNPRRSIWVDDEVWPEETWEDSNVMLLSSTEGHNTHLVSLPYSRGRISVASDLKWIENADTPTADAIAVKQNASLLWHLVQLSPHPQVWLISSENSPSLWFWLWNYGRYALAGLACLLMLSAWRAWVQFGPKLPPEQAKRRRLLEHIQATGWFHWQEGHWLTLLAAAQAATHERIKLRQPQWHDLPQDVLFDKLAEFCQLPRTQIAQAFSPQAAPNAQQFSQLILTLDTIRKKL